MSDDLKRTIRSPEDRSYYAREIWRIRKSRGTDEVPF